jgi:imidazolonepropionase-like amidohydrolase
MIKRRYGDMDDAGELENNAVLLISPGIVDQHCHLNTATRT